MGETVDYGLIVTLADGTVINETLPVENSLSEDEAEYAVSAHLMMILNNGFSIDTLTGRRFVSPYNIVTVEYVRPILVLGA